MKWYGEKEGLRMESGADSEVIVKIGGLMLIVKMGGLMLMVKW